MSESKQVSRSEARESLTCALGMYGRAVPLLQYCSDSEQQDRVQSLTY